MAAMNGLQIQKLLPKTNCKECGSNTCLAFAMRLAAKKASLDECPYASEEAKQILGAASEPPVKTLTIGDRKIGGETVLYRHEKTFVNEAIIAVNVDDTAADAKETLEKIRDYTLERVGEILTVGAVSVRQTKPDAGDFLALVKTAHEITGLPVILRSADKAALKEAAAALKDSHSIMAGIRDADADEMRAVCEANGLSMAITADNLDGIVTLGSRLREAGYSEYIAEFPASSFAELFQTNAIARTMAIKQNFKPLGNPSISFIDTGDVMDDTAMAVSEVEKYGGICVLPSFNPAQLVTLMTLRLNIFTDPQKPIQVEPKVYAIGEPDRNSPVFVTTNFSLTYFIVSGEIENSGISAWLVIPECEGFSVLTAWAAGKFSGAHIAKYVKEFDLESMVDTRKIIIPGYVAQISGELEEALPGWKVIVGTQEASDIEAFVNAFLK